MGGYGKSSAAEQGINCAFHTTVAPTGYSCSVWLPQLLLLAAAPRPQPAHLVKAGGKEGEGGEDGAVGAPPVLLHHILVVDSVADVDVGAIGQLGDGGVEVDDVAGIPPAVQVCVQALHEGGLPAARHAYGEQQGKRGGRRERSHRRHVAAATLKGTPPSCCRGCG